MTAEDVLALFAPFDLTPEEAGYLPPQARRIAHVIDVVQRYCSMRSEPSHILDVGPHFLTRCMAESITPRPIMSTLGYPFPKLMPPEMVHLHATMDFNDCISQPPPFEPGTFDIITICEVVEHMLVPPDAVLSFLARMLKRPHGVILVGTPNAVSLTNRLRMMMGENPFQRLEHDWRSYRVHIREYTMQELREYGAAANLRVAFEEYCDYWDYSIFVPGMNIMDVAFLEQDVPSYKNGLTIVYQH